MFFWASGLATTSVSAAFLPKVYGDSLSDERDLWFLPSYHRSTVCTDVFQFEASTASWLFWE